MGLKSGLGTFVKRVAGTTPVGATYNLATGGLGKAWDNTLLGGYVDDAAQSAYTDAYGKPADQVKQGYTDAADKTRSLGTSLSNVYAGGAARGQGYYSTAQGVFDAYGGTSAPQSAAPAAGGASAPRFTSSLSSDLRGALTPISALASGGTPAPGQSSAPQGPTGATYSQDYYKNAAANNPTTAQNYFTQRQATGYGDNPLTSRYADRSATQNQSYLEDNLTGLGNFASEGTSAAARSAERKSSMSTPDLLDKRVGERYDFAGQPTNTSGAMSYINGLTPGAQTAGVSNQLQGFDPGQYTGNFSNALERGETAGTRMLSDLVSGKSQTGQLMSSLQSGKGDTANFLNGFDPNATQGLGETYKKLAAEGPTYEEDFYNSQLAGDNPAYNQLKSDFVKDTRRSAAARGGFASGRAIDIEDRGLSRLAADEFANRGALAASAGSAHRDQLGQQLSGAQALDTNLLDRSKLTADVAQDREGRIASLADRVDTLRSDTANNTDARLATLATTRDTQGLDRLKALGDLSTTMDSETRLSGDQRLSAAKQQDTFLRNDQDALDALANDVTKRNENRDTALDTLATNNDTTRTTRMSDYGDTLSTADKNREDRLSNIDALAQNTGDSIFNREKQIDLLAGKSADEGQSNADRTFNASKEASAENRDIYKTRFDQALKLGDTKSAIDQVYTMAQAGAISATEMSAIGQELSRAGVDAATVQAVIKDGLTLLGEAGKGAAAVAAL